MFKETTNNPNLIITRKAIGVDADSIHSNIKQIIINNAINKSIETIFVSDRALKDIQSIKDKYNVNIKNVVVKSGENSADDYIVQNADKFFLVITHDIPLSERLIKKNVMILNERGDHLTNDNIREYLSIRDVMNTMRELGIYEKKGIKHPITQRDIKKFSDTFNALVLKYLWKNQ